MGYTVILDNRGNPDFGQDTRRKLPGTKAERKRVRDFEEASKACRDYIRKNDLGGGNWTGGSVLDSSGMEVARVSYNGKVWPPGPFTPDMEPLWPKPTAVQGKPRDPFDFESAIIDSQFGPIEITGCFRVAMICSAARKFSIDGRSCDFRTFVSIREDGEAEIPHDFSLLACGTFDVIAKARRTFVRELEGIVKDWLSKPENMAIIVANEIKDRQKTIDQTKGVVASLEKQMAERLDEIASDQRAVSHYQEMLAGLGNGSPKP